MAVRRNAAQLRRLAKRQPLTPMQKRRLSRLTGGRYRPGGGGGNVYSSPALDLYSQQDLQNLADQLTNEELQPQIDAVNRQIADAQRQAQAGASTIQGFTNATLPYLQQIAPQVQNTYTNAANMDAMFAKGFSDGLANLASQDAASQAAALQTQGAPAAQIANVSNIGAPASNVLYGTGGYIPGTTLGAEGAAQASLAAGLPSISVARGRESMNSLLANAQATQKDLSQQLADIESTRGTETAKNLNDLMSQELNKVQTILAAKAAGVRVQTAKQVAAAKARQQKFDNAVRLHELQQGDVRLNQGQQRINNSKKAATTKAQQAANQKRRAARQAALKDFRSAASNVVKTAGLVKTPSASQPGLNDSFGPSQGSGGKAKPAVTWVQAVQTIRRSLQSQITRLRRLGFTQAQINEYIREVLFAYGFTEPKILNPNYTFSG